MSLPLIIKDIEDRFKISGGTLTGNVEINKSSYPTVMIKDLGQGRRGEFIYNINEEVIISNYKDENNRSLLFLRNENNVNNSLQLSRVVNGQWSNYNLYGEHNKPTAADVGALSLTGGTLTGQILKLYNGKGAISVSNTFDMTIYNIANDNNNRRILSIYDTASKVNLKDSLLYVSIVDGKMSTYTIYGEHNKPAPADIGAPTTTGSGASGTWPISISGSAAKLSSARSIALGGDLAGSANFDGSGNITISGAIANCNVSSSNTSNYPWHRIATVGPASNSYNDYEMIIAVRHYFDGGGYGLAKVSLRTNLNSNCGAKIVWMYRYNISMDALRAGVVDVNGATYMDLYYYYGGGWARCKIYRLFSNGWNLINSNEVSDTTTSNKKDSYEVYTSVADGGSKIGRSYTKTITAEDGPVRPTSSGTSPMTANSSGLSTNHVYLQYT